MSKYVLCPKDDDSTTFSVRVIGEVLAQFGELQRKTNRSRNELINIAMRHFIDNVEIQESTDNKE